MMIDEKVRCSLGHATQPLRKGGWSLSCGCAVDLTNGAMVETATKDGVSLVAFRVDHRGHTVRTGGMS